MKRPSVDLWFDKAEGRIMGREMCLLKKEIYEPGNRPLPALDMLKTVWLNPC